jgi:hypothetical protein
MALVVCWRNVVDRTNGNKEGSASDHKILDKSIESLQGIKEDLIGVGSLFVKVVVKEVDIKSELDPLLKANPGLKELLGL